jgi:hypothetical protein
MTKRIIFVCSFLTEGTTLKWKINYLLWTEKKSHSAEVVTPTQNFWSNLMNTSKIQSPCKKSKQPTRTPTKKIHKRSMRVGDQSLNQDFRLQRRISNQSPYRFRMHSFNNQQQYCGTTWSNNGKTGCPPSGQKCRQN